MKKNKNLNQRLKTAKNPLSGIKTRELIITLLALLICFFSGFFGGYACNKSCKRVEASADTILSTPARPYPNTQDRSLYMFNFELKAGPSWTCLLTAGFMIYKEYTPTYLNSSHYLALANDNTISPFRYVTEQLFEYTSEEGYYGLEIIPNASDVYYELYYTYVSVDEPNYYYYDWETLDGDYSVLTYSNLAEGGFSGKFSYLFTCRYGFGIVLENGSYWFVEMYPVPVGEDVSSNIHYGIGNIYTYDDIFGSLNTDTAFQNGYDKGKLEGDAEGFARGKAEGKAEGDAEGFARGKAEGEEIGYQRGIGETLDDITPWQHIVNGINHFLTIELLPGVPFSMVLSLAFGLILLGFAIKIFLGG